MVPVMIRPYRHDDGDAVLKIFNAVIADGDAFYFETPFTIDDLERYIAASTATFVAVLNDRVAGGYMVRPNLPGRSSHIANAAYYVDAGVRGQGLGRMLGEHSLQQAKQLGFQAMQFNAVVANNQPAVSLWLKLGFSIIGTVPTAFRMADGGFSDLHILHRDLQAHAENNKIVR